MSTQRILIILLIGVIAAIAYIVGSDLYSRSSGGEGTDIINQQHDSPANQGGCVPTFADGGGPYYQPDSPFREKIVPEENDGERLIVSGQILRNDCSTPIPNAVLDVWQANESGSYQDEWYRGQVRADENGNYTFETVVPEGYGEGTGYRPPHIHFKVFVEDREVITSQMFFPEVAGTPGFEDAYIMEVRTERDGDSVVHRGYHDVVLPIE